MPKPSPNKPIASLKYEFSPDAWERFETLIQSAAKTGHQPHKPTPSQPQSAVEKERQPPVAKK